MLSPRSRQAVLPRKAAGLLSLGIAIALSGGGCADRLLLYPSVQPIDSEGATSHLLRVHGRVVEVFIAGPIKPGQINSGQIKSRQIGQPSGYVLDFCGNATRAEQIASDSARRWDAQGLEVWAMNYPGYGQSEGPASLASMPMAALGVFDQLREIAGDRPIFVSGRSIGTTIALCVAARRPVAGLLLHSPTPLTQLIIQRQGWWNLWVVASIVALQIPGEMNSVRNAKLVNAPAVIVETVKDRVVPLSYQMKVVDAYAGPKRSISLLMQITMTPSLRWISVCLKISLLGYGIKQHTGRRSRKYPTHRVR